jgi:hypothetical protein
METKCIDIADFKRDNSFYGEIDLLITIKSFDLKAIRARYLKSKNNKSKRTGSVERRAVTEGGVANISISKGEITSLNVLAKLPEPRGIDYHNGIIALSSEDKVFIIKENKIYTITDPWFSYIHTCKINPFDTSKVLVSSSGFDCIFEYDYINNIKTFEWFAWENGFEYGIDPESGEKIFLTRKPEKALEYKQKGINHLLIKGGKDSFLPTSKRAAFVNSVVYNPNNKEEILATYFHEGAVYSINRNTATANIVLSGLTNPHGGCMKQDNIMATSTKSGELVIKDEQSQSRYSFKKLSGKEEVLGDFEWIQNSIVMGDNIISIDSNRNAFVVFNPTKKVYDIISFDDNWAVQDLILSKSIDNNISLIENLS